MSTTDIPLALVTRNPKQPREDFPQAHIERLADSIKKRGLIQPITVRNIKREKFRYEIVAGECRFRAHQLLGVQTIRAIVVEIDETEMQLLAIVENLQRQDMNPLEEARAYQTLINNCGYDVGKIVSDLGLRSTATVNNALLLLELTPEIQKLVASGQMAQSMARGIAVVSRPRQHELLRAVLSGKLRTVEQVRHAGIALRDAESQVDAFGEAPKASSKDVSSLNRFESKIEAISTMIATGYKDGECVAAERVSPDRVRKMADQLALIRKHVLDMEHSLRRAAAQGDIMLQLHGSN